MGGSSAESISIPWDRDEERYEHHDARQGKSLMHHDGMRTDETRGGEPAGGRRRGVTTGREPSPAPLISPAAGALENRLDIKLLGQAIIELNIARKNFSIYPAGHAQLDRSIQRAYNALSRLLETTPSLTVGVARDCLFIGESYLDRKNMVFQDFALSLHSRDIAAVTFMAGVPREEIHRFCAVLTRDTADIRESGGIEQAMREAGTNHVRVQPIDFSGLHLTEEQEITAAGAKATGDIGGGVRPSFVAHLLSGQLDAEGQPQHLARNKLKPSEIARLLNTGVLNLKRAIKSFETTVTNYVRHTTGTQPLENFIALLKDLNPQLRRQFLSVTFDRVSDHGNEILLDSFPDDVVAEMIQQANEEGKEISPTLIARLERISQIRISRLARSRDAHATAADSKSTGRLSRENVKDLLSRESYETYVDPDYQSLLKSLITEGGPDGGVSSSGKPAMRCHSGVEGCTAPVSPSSPHPFRNVVEENELDLRLTQMMLALIEKTVDYDDYLVFSRKIVEGTPAHLNRGNLELVYEVLQLFKRHAAECPPPLSELASDASRAFCDPDITTAAVKVLDSGSEDQCEWASRFLAEIGTPCLPALIRAYADTDYPSPKKAMLELLIHFGEATVEQAFLQFENADSDMLRNLLVVVQAVGKAENPVAVRRLLSHENRRVRGDALATLLQLRDPQAVDYLRRAIHSVDSEESSHAIGLAGYYRVSEVAEELADRIRTRFISRSALQVNEEILKTLNRIGDERALPKLERTASRFWTFSPRRLGMVKLTIFSYLEGYPPSSLTNLLEIGRRSGDVRIQRLSEKLASRKATPDTV